MQNDSLRKIDGLLNQGPISLEKVLSLETDDPAKVRLLTLLFGIVNRDRVCACLEQKRLSKYVMPYLEDLQRVNQIFIESIRQYDLLVTGGVPKGGGLLSDVADSNKVDLIRPIWGSFKCYLKIHRAPLARFRELQLDRLKLSTTLEARFGMSLFYEEMRQRKLKHIGFLYSLFQKSVPYRVEKARMIVLECASETWLSGVAVGDKTWVEIVQEWGKCGVKQRGAVEAFFKMDCLSSLLFSGLPNGSRPASLIFDRSAIEFDTEEETLAAYVKRSTIQVAFENILKFPSAPNHFNHPFIQRHAGLCDEIVDQELLNSFLTSIAKDFASPPNDPARIRETLRANRERLEGIYKGAIDSPQYAFALSSLIVAYLRALSPNDKKNSQELFDQIYSLSNKKREELYRACSAETYVWPKKYSSLNSFDDLIAACPGFSLEMRPFLMLRYLYDLQQLRPIPQPAASVDNEGIAAGLNQQCQFVLDYSRRSQVPMPAPYAFVHLNEQVLSKKFISYMEDIWLHHLSLIHWNLNKTLLTSSWLKNFRKSLTELELEGARLKSNPSVSEEAKTSIDWLIATVQWLTLPSKAHETYTRFLYLLPLPADCHVEKRRQARADQGRLIEVAAGHRMLWTQAECFEEGFELTWRLIDARNSLQTRSIKAFLPIRKEILEQDRELVELILDLSHAICDEFHPYDDKKVEPKTSVEAFYLLTDCKDLQGRFTSYSAQGEEQYKRGRKALDFLIQLKLSVRSTICNWSWMQTGNESQVSLGNVWKIPKGLSLLSPAKGGPFNSLFADIPIKPLDAAGIEGDLKSWMQISVLSREGRTENLPVDVKIKNNQAGIVEILLSLSTNPSICLAAKLDLKESEEERVRYLAWLILQLKAKWYEKMRV